MTIDEKINHLRVMLLPEEPSDEELSTLLFLTKGAILNARFPFGYTEEEEVPTKYEHIQLQACVVLYNKKGAEGQTAHNEQGVNRTYEVGDIPNSLLKRIVPVAGSVS